MGSPPLCSLGIQPCCQSEPWHREARGAHGACQTPQVALPNASRHCVFTQVAIGHWAPSDPGQSCPTLACRSQRGCRTQARGSVFRGWAGREQDRASSGPSGKATGLLPATVQRGGAGCHGGVGTAAWPQEHLRWGNGAADTLRANPGSEAKDERPAPVISPSGSTRRAHLIISIAQARKLRTREGRRRCLLG